MDWCTRWYILRCRGCEHVFAQTVSTDSENSDSYQGPDGTYEQFYIETVRTWPPQAKRRRPDWFEGSGVNLKLLTGLWPIMREVYDALDADLNVLAAMGMRIAFDKAARLLGVDPDLSFREKLDKLVVDDDRTRLETLVDAGSAAAHRGWAPSSEELSTMMDVLEHFVHEAFVAPVRKKRLDARVEAMRPTVPLDPRRTRKALTKPEASGDDSAAD